ncbi:Ig-like domain (group 2) [Prevotella sp. khp1]|uniref:Ig-like domain-containing protein n=1 Tax=Prevotellaceae TaxID=171552 RepID=UPI00088BEEBE|nr:MULTISPECIES: Ig-like domain-containing protein [Prevotellaceae]QVJ79584.1 hypothetical protein J4031_07520 [Xylanibacter ruminicola]SDQ33944.1 Ig-like domain (group 2) [Prevotella sp. khp1]
MKKNNFKSLMQAAVLICTPLVIASCDDVFGDVDNPIPSHLTVSQAAVNLELHAAHPEKATFIRKGIAATGAQLVYSSSDEKVATVDANGKITGVGEGECQIIVKATGLDSNGKQTYQEAEESFTVKVKDYRARIALTDEAKPAILNVADVVAAPATPATTVDLTEVLDVWPALGTDGLNITYTTVPNKKGDPTTVDPNGIISSTAGGKITLSGNTGMAKVIAKIAAKTDVPDGFEITSFSDQLETDTFVVEVKPGVAYIAGYKADGSEIRETLFKDYAGQKYTDLSDKLMNAGKTAFLTTDVTLDAGWYYVDRNLAGFNNNIRVKGDVNIILNNAFTFSTSKDVMDESAAQNYKLNFFAQKKTGVTPATGAATFANIKEFKEVNICGVNISAPANAVENVNIINGSIKNLVGTGTGNVNITDGTAWNVEKFAALTLTKVASTGTPDVDDVTNVGTVTISEGTSADDLKGITTLAITKASVGAIGAAGAANKVGTLTIDNATSIGVLTNIGTAVISETPIDDMATITDLTLKKVKTTAARTLTEIGSVTINKTDGTVNFKGIETNALNISDGTIVVGTSSPTTDAVGQIVGFTATAEQDTKVKMTGGDLKVYGPAGTVFAVKGDVEVSGGKFYAESPDHHAVSGALVGTFEGSTDGTNYTAITGPERPKYIRNKKSE